MVSLAKTLGAGAVALGAFLALGATAQAQYGVAQPQIAVPTPVQPSPAQSMVAYTTADLHLRAGAGTQFPSIAVMPRGSAIYVAYCEASQHWCFGDWNGIQGWASAAYLSATPPYQQVYPYPTPPPVVVQPAPPPPIIIHPGPRYYGNGFGIWFYAR